MNPLTIDITVNCFMIYLRTGLEQLKHKANITIIVMTFITKMEDEMRPILTNSFYRYLLRESATPRDWQDQTWRGWIWFCYCCHLCRMQDSGLINILQR